MIEISFTNAHVFAFEHLKKSPGGLRAWQQHRELALAEWGATFLGLEIGGWRLGFEDERQATLFLLRWSE